MKNNENVKIKKNPIEVVKSFFTRLFYIISLVWETAPWLFIAMILLCLVDGVMPVIGSYITKFLLDGIQSLIANSAESSGDVFKDIFTTLYPVLFLFILQFIYQFAKRVLVFFRFIPEGKLEKVYVCNFRDEQHAPHIF